MEKAPALSLIIIFLLFLALPTAAQGIIYFPVITKDSLMPAPKSTLGIVSPIEAQNYVLNPSAETTGNFAAIAGTTVNRMTSYQKYGIYAYEVDTNADNEGITLTLLAFVSERAYITMRVRGTLPASWDWSLDNVNYHEPRLLEKIDPDWSLYGVQIPASQASGATTLYVRQKGAGSGFFYLDGIQISPVLEGRYYSTYIDGAQEGCRWLGAPHASASLRSGQSRAGGIVRDFYRDYSFVVEKMIGAGSVTEELAIDSYALLPGGELNNSKIQPREFSLVGYFLADTEEALHENVQRLELEMGLNTYPGKQPFRLRFSGAKVLKEIKARIVGDGGLGGDLPVYYDDCLSVEDEKWVNNRFFKARAAVQMVAEDPFWYEVGESATVLDTLSSDTFRYIAGRLTSTGQWSNLGLSSNPTTGGDILTIAVSPFDGKVYVGGTFTGLNGVAGRNYIAAYDLTTGLWETVGGASDFNSTITSLVFGPDGTLYAGGDFTNVAGNANADFIAQKPPGAAWTNLGSGGTGTVSTVTISPIGDIYLGGSFINWAGLADADRIVYWDISAGAYAAVIVGANAEIRSIVFTSDGTTAYFGGGFTNWGDANGDGVVSWDGVALSSLLTGANGNVRDLLITNDGTLYVGGVNTQLGGVVVNGIGSWNGQTFLPAGEGVQNPTDVENMAIGPDGLLYAVGQFDQAGDVDITQSAARWNRYTWAHLDVDLPGSPIVWNIALGQPDPVVLRNYDIFLGFNSTGTGTMAGVETVANSGTISAFPKIVFSRSGGDGATIKTLRNERTGGEILFNYNLLDGETLTVDLNPKKRTIISSFFGHVWRATLPGDQLSTWQLLPGDNQISAFVSESGSPTITAYVIFRDAFRSYH